jgi:ankyrin repeat protein
MLAAQHGHTAVVRALLGANADPTTQNAQGFNALMLAGCADAGSYASIVALLLQHKQESGLNIDAVTDKGVSALMIASQLGNPEVARILMSSGAAVDQKDNRAWNALMYAAQNGHLEVVRALLERKCNVNHTALTGFTALMTAAKSDHLSVAQLLIENGAQVDICAQDGSTAHSVAKRNSHHRMTKLLQDPHRNGTASR